jgi:hypothetical protein
VHPATGLRPNRLQPVRAADRHLFVPPPCLVCGAPATVNWIYTGCSDQLDDYTPGSLICPNGADEAHRRRWFTVTLANG